MADNESTINTSFMDDLSGLDLETLKKKYGMSVLLKRIFTKDDNFSSLFSDIDLSRHFLILHFWPRDKNVMLSNKQRKAIISLLASIKPEHNDSQINEWLKSIDPNLILPENWDRGQTINEAHKLFIASENIESIVLTNTADEYLLDTLNFYKDDPVKIEAHKTEIDSISVAIENEYQKTHRDPDYITNQTVFEQGINFLSKIGRTQYFVKAEKERANAGELVDLFIKLDVAVKAAQALKTKTFQQSDLNNEAIKEITKVLKEKEL